MERSYLSRVWLHAMGSKPASANIRPELEHSDCSDQNNRREDSLVIRVYWTHPT